MAWGAVQHGQSFDLVTKAILNEGIKIMGKPKTHQQSRTHAWCEREGGAAALAVEPNTGGLPKTLLNRVGREF